MVVTLTTGAIVVVGSDVKYSSSVWFELLTKNDFQKSLKSCTHITKLRERQIGSVESTNRELITEYNVLQPISLLFVNLYEEWGRPRRYIRIVLNVKQSAPLISIKGLNGFGGFSGNAEIDFKKSTVTEDEIKKQFSYKLIQSETSSSKRRSIWL